jgi:hypothetical protein
MPLFTEVKVNQVQERPPNYHYALGCVSADGTLYEEEGCTIAFVRRYGIVYEYMLESEANFLCLV